MMVCIYTVNNVEVIPAVRPDLLDLNLLRVLRTVYATRNVTKAAQTLFTTQSAVSNALRRLRERLDDPLFIRGGDGMVPTALVQSLIGPIESGLGGIEAALRDTRAFDPQTSDRLFRVLGNDLAQMVFMPPLLRHLAGVAPDVRLETVDIPLDEARHAMSEGMIDIAVGNWPEIGSDYRRRNLFSETFVVLMSQSNPLAAGTLSVGDYLAARHVDYRPGGESYPVLMRALDTLLMARSATRRIVFTARHGLGLAAVIADSDMLLTIPGRLAASMTARLDALVSKPFPYPTPRFTISAQWHVRSDHDPAVCWFRDQFVTLFADA